MSNKNLTKAKAEKNDEFYTTLGDINHELTHYTGHFKGKTVYCNCDDPFESNFFLYFALKFDQLGLKRLIATCYGTSSMAGKQLSIFDFADEKIPKEERKAYYIDIDHSLGGMTAVKPILLEEGLVKELKGNGDFRSKECIELLKQADIVVTNPPFSLFREYIGQLMEYDKKFLIIGNMNAITYKEVFPLLKDNKVWLGQERLTDFIQPNGEEKNVAGLCRWFTNLEHDKRNEPYFLCAKYDPEKYPQYDNYDAIEVSRVEYIPEDYMGVMGVSISFLDKYCPEQFELVGATESEGAGFSNGLFKGGQIRQATINGEKVYKRLFIRRK